jgi:GDP-L-fucose synthase
MRGTVLVTGATGFVGHHVVPRLVERYGAERVIGVGSRDYDLMDPVEVRRLFRDTKPAIVIHLAAYSGGIGANRAYPADFYYRNTLLTALVFHEAARSRIEKLIYLVGACSYPAAARSPIGEDQMWDGFPEAASAGYSTAKKMGLVASICYRHQYSLNSVVLVPGNMYGKFDNFHRDDSHVIPALIRRFHEARESGAEQVSVWGSGRPLRDFVYAGDVANLIPYFIENYDSTEPVNISSGTATSIADLAEIIKEATDFEGEIAWDTSLKDGQLVKILDTGRMNALGLSCPTPLKGGIARTVDWFRSNYTRRPQALRL